ncbi:hypothetical protein DFQ27_003795, partial [Actinomortierella ambigua]
NGGIVPPLPCGLNDVLECIAKAAPPECDGLQCLCVSATAKLECLVKITPIPADVVKGLLDPLTSICKALSSDPPKE